METASPTTRERDLFATRLASILIALAVAGLLLFGLAGCSTFWHAVNVSTLDDLHGYAADQLEFHRVQTESEADMGAGTITPAQHVSNVRAAIVKSSVDFHTRTPDPTKGGGPDWNTILPLAFGGIATIVATLAQAKAGKLQTSVDAAHAKAAALEKSIAETDDWVDDTEKTAHANTVAVAALSGRVPAAAPVAQS